MTSTSPAPSPRRNRLARIGVGFAAFVVLLWLIEVADYLLPADLDRYGVMPRDPAYLPNIALVPLLHGGFDHVAANTLPLAVLGILSAMVAGGRTILVGQRHRRDHQRARRMAVRKHRIRSPSAPAA